MRFQAVILCTLSLVFSLKAQSTFENVISENTADIPSSVIELDDGYLICARGNELSFGGWRGIKLIKTDIAGNVVWRKFIGKPNFVYSPGETGSMIKTNDGGFIIGGRYGNIPLTERIALLVKLNNNGDTLWTKDFGQSFRFTRFNSVNQCSDKGFLSFGFTDESDPQGDYYLVKTDSVGNFEWKKTYGGSGKEIGLSIGVDSKNQILLSGASQSFSADQSGYFLKVDSLGNIIYDISYGTVNGFDAAASLTKLRNDEFLLWGGLDTFINNTEYQWAQFITKFDTFGNPIWRTFLSKKQNHNLWQVREMPDRSIVFIGDVTYGEPYENAGWIGKLDENGHLLWERFHTYKERDYFNKRAIFQGDFQQTKDGGYVVAGIVWRQEDTTISSAYNTMTWLVKLDSTGCLNGDCGIPVSVDEISISDNNQVIVYPNPTHNTLHFKSPPNQQIRRVTVIDLNGKSIIQAHQSSINTSELSQGVYFYQVEMESGKLFRGKFIKD